MNTEHRTSNFELRTFTGFDVRSSMFKVRRSQGFTLVEIVIGLTIIGILAGMAIPAIRSIEKEREARAPVAEPWRGWPGRFARGRWRSRCRIRSPLTSGVSCGPILQSLRRERRVRSTRPADRSDRATAGDHRCLTRAGDRHERRSRTDGGDRALETAREGMKFHEVYELPDGVRYSLLFWGETDWIDMNSGLFRRWVFQPSGMCQPLKIQVGSRQRLFRSRFPSAHR